MGQEYVINEAQAKTVRKIFDMYLTAMGKSLWHFSTIGHALKNRLYCGGLEYQKEYAPDYLEQKRIKNRGELDRVIAKDRHQPIVTKEEFEQVQKLIVEKSP